MKIQPWTLGVVLLMFWAGPSLADDWYWSGTCSYNEWHEICVGDWCDPEETVHWYLNNWGELLCGSDELLFPDSSDNVYLGSGDVLLRSNGGAAAYNLSLAAGGLLTVCGPPMSTATLTMTGPLLINDGTIHLGSISGARLLFEQTATVEGGGVVWLDRAGVGAQLNTETGATLTNATGHTIRGRGTINATLVNDGTVTSDTESLWLSTNDKTNNATIRAINGELLYVDGITLTQSPQGQLLADGGYVSVTSDATVSGGTLVTANDGGMHIASGTNTLQDVTIAADSAVTVGGTGLILAGSSVTNNGTVTCGPDSDLLVQDDLILQGNGELELVNNELNTAVGVTLTHGSEHTIHGRGTINAAMVNNGTTIGTSSAGIVLAGNDKSNSALMEGLASGRVTVEGIALTQTGSGQLIADAGYVDLRDGATVVGGTLACANGGYIANVSGSNTIQDVAIPAGADIRVGGTSLNLRGANLTCDGIITVNYTSALVIEDNLALEGSGEVILSSGTVSTAADKTLTLGGTQSIHGTGYINAALINYGLLMPDSQNFELTPQSPGATNHGTIYVPGPAHIMRIYQAALFTQTGGEIIVDGILYVYDAPLDLQGGTLTGSGDIYGDVSNAGATVEPGASAGTLEINGSFAQGSAGALSIEIAGPTPGTEYDLLDVDAAASLDGELRVEFINGYVPEGGREFVILTASPVTGVFGTVTAPGRYTVTYNPNNVTFMVIARGDFDSDGDVDLDDYAVFADCMAGPGATPDPILPGVTTEDCLESFDFDPDGDVDLYDFGEFQDGLTVG